MWFLFGAFASSDGYPREHSASVASTQGLSNNDSFSIVRVLHASVSELVSFLDADSSRAMCHLRDFRAKNSDVLLPDDEGNWKFPASYSCTMHCDLNCLYNKSWKWVGFSDQSKSTMVEFLQEMSFFVSSHPSSAARRLPQFGASAPNSTRSRMKSECSQGQEASSTRRGSPSTTSCSRSASGRKPVAGTLATTARAAMRDDSLDFFTARCSASSRSAGERPQPPALRGMLQLHSVREVPPPMSPPCTDATVLIDPAPRATHFLSVIEVEEAEETGGASPMGPEAPLGEGSMEMEALVAAGVQMHRAEPPQRRSST